MENQKQQNQNMNSNQNAPKNPSEQNSSGGFTRKLGDSIERAGDKVEHHGFKKTGDAIEKLGDKVEHSGDRRNMNQPAAPEKKPA